MLGQTNKLNLASVGLHHFDSNCTLLFALLCLHSGACTLLILCLHFAYTVLAQQLQSSAALPSAALHFTLSEPRVAYICHFRLVSSSATATFFTQKLQSDMNWTWLRCKTARDVFFFNIIRDAEPFSIQANVGCCRFGGSAAHCEIAGGFCENPTNTTNSQTKQKYHHWPWWGRMKRYF